MTDGRLSSSELSEPHQIGITSLFPRARAGAVREAVQASPPEAIAAVRALNQQYVAARTNYAERFRRRVADDAVIVLGDGRRLRKPDFLALLNDEPKLYRSLAVRDVTLRAFEGRWQVVSAQVTPLPG